MRATVTYATRGKLPLKMDVLTPNGRGPYPAVVCFHGGGWTKGDRGEFLSELTWLAQNGLAGCSVDYRPAGPNAYWPSQLSDAEDALSYLKTHGRDLNLRPSGFGVWGKSAGGQIALLLAAVAGDQAVAAAVGWYAPSDLTQAKTPKQKAAVRALLGPAAADRDALQDASAIYHAADLPPTLLLHGGRDTLVPPDQSRALRDAVNASHGRCELVQVKEAGHGFKNRVREAAGHQTAEWLATELE